MIEEKLFQQLIERAITKMDELGRFLTKEEIAAHFGEFVADDAKQGAVAEYLQSKWSKRQEVVTKMEKDSGDACKKQLEIVMQIMKAPGTASEHSGSALDQETARLVELYLPYVEEIAKLYEGQGETREDLIGEGNLALIVSAKMLFLADSLQEAESILMNGVMQSMEALIMEASTAGRSQRQVAEQLNQILDASEELTSVLMRKPTPQEVAEHLSITMEQVVDAIYISPEVLSEVLDFQSEWQVDALDETPEEMSNEMPEVDIDE